MLSKNGENWNYFSDFFLQFFVFLDKLFLAYHDLPIVVLQASGYPID